MANSLQFDRTQLQINVRGALSISSRQKIEMATAQHG
jgi:hypothetical protein